MVQADEVARRLHVLLHDVHREHLAMRRRFHDQRAQARLGDNPAARYAELRVAAQELGIARPQEPVEAGGATCRRPFVGLRRKRCAAVAAGGFE